MSSRLVFAFLAATCAVAPASANLLINGDFESGPARQLPQGWNLSAAVPGGPYNIPNVQVVVLGDYGGFVSGSAAARANRAVVYGGGDAPTLGGIVGQSFATGAGNLYTVAFDWGALVGATPQTVTAEVRGSGGVLATFEATATSTGSLDTAFARSSFTFIAVSAVSELRFTTLSPTVYVDSVLDNVDVTLSQQAAAVPEPSTWALMILGFGLTGVAVRRRALVA